jgi:RNA polymerase sigma-70 factor (ECF subfamily)
LELEKLIKSVIKKKRKAQLEFYRRYFGLLMSVAYKYYNNEEDAAAIVNTAFLKIFDNLDKYNFSSPIEAWMRRITINHIIDEFRKNKKYSETFVDTKEESYSSESNLNEIETDIEDEVVASILEQLPNATKNVFCLYAIDGFSHKEITELLNISYETSKWHVKEARKRLRELLTKHQSLIG